MRSGGAPIWTTGGRPRSTAWLDVAPPVGLSERTSRLQTGTDSHAPTRIVVERRHRSTLTPVQNTSASSPGRLLAPLLDLFTSSGVGPRAVARARRTCTARSQREGRPLPPSPQAPLRLGVKPRSCTDAAEEQCFVRTAGRRQRLCLVVPFFCVHVLPSATAARPANKIALFTHPFLLPLWINASLRSAAPPQAPSSFQLGPTETSPSSEKRVLLSSEVTTNGEAGRERRGFILLLRRKTDQNVKPICRTPLDLVFGCRRDVDWAKDVL